MFSNSKTRFVFQLICSFLTIPVGAIFTIGILDGMFGLDFTAFYNLFDAINPDGFINQMAVKYGDAIFIAMIVIHVLALIGSGGLKYSLKLYAGAVKGAFLVPIAILNLILGVVVAGVGLFFIIALAPIFAFVSTIINHIESKELAY